MNGSLIASTPGGAGSLSTVRQMWNPAAPGDYVISVRALSISGAWGGEAVAHVNIFDAQFQTLIPLTETPHPLPTPTSTPISVPVFVLIKNANCRVGPGQVFNEINAAYAGDSMPIEGKNEDGTWWLVRLPNGDRCWISGTTGNPNGNLDKVPFDQGPPTPIPPEPTQAPQGCYVYDPNQQLVCAVPCPPNAQPGGLCAP